MNTKSDKVIAIHQPNLFPWLGFFDKIYRSNLFVYLDHVENNPRDPLWTKRVGIVASKKKHWLTIPLARTENRVFLPINEMEISRENFERKHLRTIEQSYGGAPFFYNIFPLIKQFYEDRNIFIAQRNILFIDTVCERLHIGIPKVRSSEYSWEASSTELLIEIIKHFQGTGYICGEGAKNYQDENKFQIAGIKLIYQSFQHPTYEQFNTKEFIPGLSIIDVLMNYGFEKTRDMYFGIK